MYGFYDALSIFSSTLVLMISAAMEDPDAYENVADDGIGVAWSLLRSMKDDGNVPASDYYEQLVQIEEDLQQACARRRNRIELPLPSTINTDGLHLLLAASGTDTNETALSAGVISQSGNSLVQATLHTESDALNDPFLSGFLSQPQAAWTSSAFEPMFTSENGEQQLWDFNWDSGGII